MKSLRMLQAVLKRTNATKLIAAFVLFFPVDALLIMLVEPGIHTYGEAIRYC